MIYLIVGLYLAIGCAVGWYEESRLGHVYAGWQVVVGVLLWPLGFVIGFAQGVLRGKRL